VKYMDYRPGESVLRRFRRNIPGVEFGEICRETYRDGWSVVMRLPDDHTSRKVYVPCDAMKPWVHLERELDEAVFTWVGGEPWAGMSPHA